ncbi:MAG: SulP family inorganic anion transporter [Patulibacter sp.]|nr:SulP family inorganic anion transporter [Patulibacter sp.]
MLRRLVPGWIAAYDRAWLRPDLLAGIVIWSVVTPQAVAYAQIAGLPPQAGLMAAPGAMIAYALVGTSRQLMVSATTATAALSAAAIGPLAAGDPARFAALSATLAIVTAVVLVAAGTLRLGAIADLVSKPVMTGFLFGLGLTIAVGQLPTLLGVAAGDGDFFPRVRDLLSALDAVDPATLAVGVGSIAALVVARRLFPVVPPTLLVLVLSIAVSAIFGLDRHEVEVVGEIPHALSDPGLPAIGAGDVVRLVTPALGVLILSAEAVGVARQLAVKHGYRVDANRDLVGLGAGNLIAGLSAGFVQSGGASQTAAADAAGGRSQLAAIVCAGLLLLTGAFLAPLFEPLPQATLAAIVLVAVAGFYDVAGLRRFVRVRRSAAVFAAIALLAVLVLGVLQGLVLAAGLSLLYVVRRLGQPDVGVLARDPDSGAWGRIDRHPDWRASRDPLVLRHDGALLYPNADGVRERCLELVTAADPRPAVVILDLSLTSDLGIQSADAIGDLAAQLRALDVVLGLAEVRAPVAAVLRRAGVADETPIAPTVDVAIERMRRRRSG